MCLRFQVAQRPTYHCSCITRTVHTRCSSVTQPSMTAAVTVHKPLCDQRNYEYRQLQNGVRVIVVQDEKAVYAATCASVQVGYFHDPANLAGAAHFLEHMVHLGSCKFPDEKEYKSFLAQHGGSSNASTSMVHTRFHFKVHSSALQGALHRFGAMLSCPLIDPDSAAREVQNVHSEYSRNANSDSRKLLQLRRSLCEAPYSNFSTGCIDTLWEQPKEQGLDVPQALRTLWESYYKAEATCVAVVGPQEPQQLLQWVQDAFQDMPTSRVLKCSSTNAVNNTKLQQSESGCCDQGQLQAKEIDVASKQQHPAGYQLPTDVVSAGRRSVLVRVHPQRDLRELELSWYIPQGMMTHSSTKSWSWASHLLGHEGPGSVAHLLKSHGLVQTLSVGVGDEVRMGRGWMFWRVQVSLTEAGEQALSHVVATIHRGIQVLQRCSDAELQSTWQEAALLAELGFNWQDPSEPLPCAQTAAYALHYYPPEAALSGSRLMTNFEPSVLRSFVNQLTTDNLVVYYSSRKNQGLVDSKERWYGAEYSVQALPQTWLDDIQRYTAVDVAAGHCDGPAQGHDVSCSSILHSNSDASAVTVASTNGSTQLHHHHQQQEAVAAATQSPAHLPLPGELHLHEPNWALPSDLDLRHGVNNASSCTSTVPYDGATAPPDLLLEQPGLCVWHRTDTSYGLPKVHLRLHLVTPLVYSSPEASVSTRLLLRVLDDVLLPVTYPAELAGSWHDISTQQGGLVIKVVGFPGVAQKLALMVVQGLLRLTKQQVQERFATMSGRLMQSLTNWAKNSPQEHAEYGAHHLLQKHHHHNAQLLKAAADAATVHLLELQQQLSTGADLHVDMLAYGNISREETTELLLQLTKLMKPQGLPAGVWPAAGSVLSLSAAAAAAAAVLTSSEYAAQAAPEAAVSNALADSDSCNTTVTYLPDNPNPSNSNSAIYYIIQLGPDSVSCSVLLDMFVQMSSKAAFHELRTRQRLGYSVSLNSSSLHRQLGLTVRIQSPSSDPDVLVAAVRGWLAGFRDELQGMMQQQWQNAQKALRDKYLDPPKSLQEAAKRAWIPIHSRTMMFDRRRQKAAAAYQTSPQQLLEFYDLYLHPDGPKHQALCVQIWGGRQKAPATKTAAADGSSSRRSHITCQQAQHKYIVTVLPEGLDAYKRSQLTMPSAGVQLPPAAATPASAAAATTAAGQ